MNKDWMRIANEEEVPSPALLVYPERIEENLRRMIEIARGPERLRPHIKTHKLPQLVSRQTALGITKCKCATIAEAEMAAAAGAQDILFAAQAVGPNARRFAQLAKAFPAIKWRTIVDDSRSARALGAAAENARVAFDALIDLDVGQHRTGIAPGPEAVALFLEAAKTRGLRAIGFHAYDGHIHQQDLAERTAAADGVWAQVEGMIKSLKRAGARVELIVLGGTPTFPIHAQREGVELSPGTCVLWDAGYAAKLPDMEFQIAAAVMTRVVSRPARGRVCLDLGHKAVASEMPHPRVVFPALREAKAVAHNEEHLVLETERAADLPVGSVLYGFPWHICPTVALHSSAYVIRDGKAVEEWPVLARARRLSF